jgi:hypothetical protein
MPGRRRSRRFVTTRFLNIEPPATFRRSARHTLGTPSRSIPKMSGFESRLLPQLLKPGPGASCGPWVMRTLGKPLPLGRHMDLAVLMLPLPIDGPGRDRR